MEWKPPTNPTDAIAAVNAEEINMGRDRSNQGSIFHLTRDELFELASAKIVRRGIGYAKAGRVTDIAQGDSRLEARVMGTEKEPYLVSLEYDGDEILSECTCPFDWEPFCKHSIATLAAHSGLAEATAASGDREVEKQEVGVRQKRAAKEGFRIRRRDGEGVFGIFDIVSPSRKTYTVEIRSVGERVNSCTCPDFETAMLGTCKHIEAVLLAHQKRAKRKFAKAAVSPPSIAQVLVDRNGPPRIRLISPESPTPGVQELARDYFDMEGYFAGDIVADFTAFLGRARRLRKIVVYDDAIALSNQVAAERQGINRKEAVRRDALKAGARVPGLKVELYPYQVEGAAFLAACGRGLLGDDMGLGKTVQAIAAAQLLRMRGESRRALVVCPASLKHQWEDEIRRFAGLDTQVVGGSVPERLAQFRRQAPFTIVNYELIMRDHRGIAALAPDLLILDEAQRIRNWRTKTAASIKQIDTPYAFVLTGTPLQNRLDDLYSVMQVVDRRILGPLWAYNEQFIVREEGKSKIAGYKNLDELRRRLTPHVLRRTKSDVAIQLPERVDSLLSVELTELQRDLMLEAMGTAARLAKIAEKRPLTPIEEQRMMAAMQCARMACNAAGLVDKETVGSPKLDEFEQVVQDICADRKTKVVVFSEWETFGRMAAQRAERHDIGFVRLHGGVPTAKRGALIEKFRDDPRCQIFFSTDAGGVGLNLQFASTVINLDIPWNPAVFDQRIGRVHRHGQKDPVHVIVIASEDSFESGLIKTLGTKRSLFAAALDLESEAESVEAPASCLAAVRSVLLDLESGIAPIIVDSPNRDGEPSGLPGGELDVSAAKPEPEQAGPLLESADPVGRIAGVLGTRLRRIVSLPSGNRVALVDKLDEVTREAAKKARIGVAEIGVLNAMADLGDDSPFAKAETIFEQPVEGDTESNALQAEQLAVAARKIEAAKTLADSGLGTESIALSSQAMHATLRALITDETGSDDLPPARLLYEKLVPAERLTLEQAAIISRADSLSKAYANSVQTADPGLVGQILNDAKRLLVELGP